MNTVADIIAVMDAIAPSYLAEEWDNVGLQIGSKKWLVEKIWVALDPSPVIIQKACQEKVDLLITHHPMFFNPIRTVDIDTIQGRLLQLCIVHKLSVYSAHTNLDSVRGGLNDIFADCIGVQNCRIFNQSEAAEDGHGIGRIGELQKTIKIEELALEIKQRLNLKSIRMVGDPELVVSNVAICTGSGAGLLKQFISSEAQVYITGDMKYHDAMSVMDAGKGLIDVGHFASEHIMVDAVADRLKDWLQRSNCHAINVQACHLERDPFLIL